MILHFDKFINEIFIGEPKKLGEGDKVVCRGTIQSIDEDGHIFHVDIEGQTGTIVQIQHGSYRFCGVVFDNYFSNVLNDLDRRLKINRCRWIPSDKLEVIPVKKGKSIKFSQKFKKIFEYIEYLEYPIITENVNFVDITDRPDTISYLSNERFERLEIWNENDTDSIKEIYSSSLRQEMKIGRFIQIMNPYTNKMSLDKKINIYKSAYKNIIQNKYNFKIISGEDIRYWYNAKNYYNEAAGSLNRSCMKNSMDRLNLYCENPDKIKMLIMTNDDNKLLGRSLIWNVDKPKCVYMDRPYTVFQEDAHTFYDYAIKHNWKIYENFKNNKMFVHLKKDYGDPDYNPYMDTFIIFCLDGDEGKNYLTTNTNGCEEYNYYQEA